MKKLLAISALSMFLLTACFGSGASEKERYINVIEEMTCLVYNTPNLLDADLETDIKAIFEENGFDADDEEAMLELATKFDGDADVQSAAAAALTMCAGTAMEMMEESVMEEEEPADAMMEESEAEDRSGVHTSSLLGVTLKSPENWTVEENENSIVLSSDANDQNIYLFSFEDLKDKNDVKSWYQASDFPTPVSEIKETKVAGLPAIQHVENNYVLVPKGDAYYMITDCQDLECTVVEESVFEEFIESLEFAN